MVLYSPFVDLRFAKKMQRVYRSIQEKELAVVAAEVYRNIFFLSIDGGDPPKVGWKNLAAFTLILLVVMAGFAAFIVGLS